VVYGILVLRGMAKFIEKAKARKLRKKGQSIKEISKKLSVSVSSVSNWCRDIELTNDQLRKLKDNARNPYYGKRLDYIKKQKQIKNEKINRLLKEGIKDISIATRRELFLVGVALYWAEGFKKDSQAGFASSDPAMMKIFLLWLFKCCNYHVKDLSFRVTLNISHRYRVEKVQKYWCDVLNVSSDNFQKPYFQKTKWKKVYENPDDYYGVLRVKVRKSTDFLRKIHGWIEGLKRQV
jgi:transcriptional regulator with XRE-family HTH domain